MSLRTDSPLVDPDVIARVLAKGRSTGAEFSEIYVEDKRSTSAGLDDGKVEQVTSGRDRGAGIRVIAGDTTGFAHTSDLSERGLLAAAEAAAAAAAAAGPVLGGSGGGFCMLQIYLAAPVLDPVRRFQKVVTASKPTQHLAGRRREAEARDHRTPKK